VAVDISFYEQAAAAVLSGRLSEFMFRRLHHNAWTSAQERWLPAALVDAALALPAHIPDGVEITIGLDAAIRRDRFAVVCVYNEELPDGTRRAHVMSKAFAPDYDGAYINHEDVQTYILGLGARYSIREIVYDPAYLQLLVNGLAERGIECTPFPQSAAKMTPATETFQRLMIEEQVALGSNNRELVEHIAACAVKPTETGVRLSKMKALMPTDLAIALAMALEAVYGGEQVGDDFAILC
jgi:phage terminase large subunit-like protein